MKKKKEPIMQPMLLIPQRCQVVRQFPFQNNIKKMNSPFINEVNYHRFVKPEFKISEEFKVKARPKEERFRNFNQAKTDRECTIGCNDLSKIKASTTDASTLNPTKSALFRGNEIPCESIDIKCNPSEIEDDIVECIYESPYKNIYDSSKNPKLTSTFHEYNMNFVKPFQPINIIDEIEENDDYNDDLNEAKIQLKKNNNANVNAEQEEIIPDENFNLINECHEFKGNNFKSNFTRNKGNSKQTNIWKDYLDTSKTLTYCSEDNQNVESRNKEKPLHHKSEMQNTSKFPKLQFLRIQKKEDLEDDDKL